MTSTDTATHQRGERPRSRNSLKPPENMEEKNDISRLFNQNLILYSKNFTIDFFFFLFGILDVGGSEHQAIKKVSPNQQCYIPLKPQEGRLQGGINFVSIFLTAKIAQQVEERRSSHFFYKNLFDSITGFPRSWKILKFETILESHGKVMDFCLFSRSHGKLIFQGKVMEFYTNRQFCARCMAMAVLWFA